MSVFVWKESIAILFHNLNISFNLPCNWFVCCLPSDEMNRIVNCREYIVQLEQQQEMLRRQVRGNSVEKYLNVFSSDWAPMLLSRTRRWTWCRAASATSGTCPSTSPTSWTSRQCKAASLWHKEWYRDFYCSQDVRWVWNRNRTRRFQAWCYYEENGQSSAVVWWWVSLIN